MKKKWICGSIIAALLSFMASGCCNSQRIVQFEGIYADGVQGMCGLYNPSRGFRLETALDVAMVKENPGRQLAMLSEKYASDSVSLSQSYFYLTFLADKELTDDDFATMQAYFDELHRLGKRAVLRFAYEKDFMGRSPIGPTAEQILRHLDQLKLILHANKDLILVVQAGLIGAWGEWHSSIHGLENSEVAKKVILEKLLSVVPQEKNIQVRVPEYKNLLKDRPELYKRISFHDDFIVIHPDRWDGDMHEGTPHFDQIVKESPYLVVDGELPRGFWSVGADPDSPSAGWLIDGMQAARRLFLQHFTSLSVIHNYKEQHVNRRFNESNPPRYSMLVWKETMITEDSLAKYHMPVSSNYFRLKDGSRTERSVFDYVRDHLGCRLELQSLQMPSVLKSGQENKLELTLINRGFATVFGDYTVRPVLMDEAGQVIELPAVLVNPVEWQPFDPADAECKPLLHCIDLTCNLPQTVAPGNYKLGLWIADASERLKYNARYAIRCANGNTEWTVTGGGRYGINILAKVQVE
ncbi:MAG: DUF4832 domain-containing protein [Bacteroides sp.]|nr:DUF4832 domain-containing protein [Bacteroides sp.]